MMKNREGISRKRKLLLNTRMQVFRSQGKESTARSARNFDACFASAVRVRFGRCAIDRFLRAVAAAFLMFRRAADR